MISLLAILVFLAESLLMCLWSGAFALLLASTGIIFLPIALRVRSNLGKTLLLSVGAILVATGLVLSDADRASVVIALIICQVLQSAAASSAMCVSKTKSAGVPFYGQATAAFVLPTLVASVIAFAEHQMLPPLVGVLMGALFLICAVLLTDVGLRRSFPRTVAGGNAEIPLASRNMVLLAVCLSLAIASLVTKPLIHSAEFIQEQVRLKWDQQQQKDSESKKEPEENQRKKRVDNRNDEEDAGAEIEQASAFDKPSDLGTPIFYVDIHSDARSEEARMRQLYGRVLTADTLVSNTWISAKKPYLRYEDPEDGVKDGRVTLSPDPATVDYTASIRDLRYNRLPCLPGLKSIRVPQVLELEPDSYLSTYHGHVLNVSYRATSSPVIWEDISGRKLQFSVVAPVYTSVSDDELAPLVSRLLDSRIDASDIFADKVNGLVGLFATNAIVTQSSVGGRSPNSFVPVFEQMRGSQAQLTTAFILCMRGAGIPCRLASGYASRTCGLGQERYVFVKEGDLVWAEVPVEGYGWVVVDPWIQDAVPRELGDAMQGEVNSYTDLANLRVGWKYQRTSAVFKWLRRLSPFLLTAVAMITVMIAMWLSRRPKTENQRIQRRVHAAYGGAPSFYRMFCKHYASRGCKKKPGMTPREYLEELKQQGLVGDNHDSLVDYLCSICYGGKPRQHFMENRFKMQFWNKQ
jgi:transglutaminase-like putative cysteine protease